MVSMKALMSLSQYDMGVLDGIAKVKDMLTENNSCNGKISRLIENYHSGMQAEMVGIADNKPNNGDENIADDIADEFIDNEFLSGDYDD